jgi:hypothetical protein
LGITLRSLEVKEGKTHLVRVTLLEDRLFELFTNRVFEQNLSSEPMRIDDVSFAFDGFVKVTKGFGKAKRI